MLRIMQIEQNFFNRSRWITSCEISIILRIIRKPNSIIALFFVKNISKFLRRLPSRRRSSKLLPISSHGFRFYVFFSSVQSSEIQLFRLRVAVEAIFCRSLVNKQLMAAPGKTVFPKQPRFHANIPWINLVCKQIYYRIDGILLSSSKFGQGHQP